MAKRFTDTDKWDDDWFISLPPRFKCVWEHIRDTCDGAGFKKISFAKLGFLVGEAILREEFDQFLGDRAEWVNHETVWIHGFIKAQYKRLSPKNAAHRNIARLALEGVRGLTLSSKAQKVIESLLEFTRDLPEALPTPGRTPSEPRAGDIGNNKKVKGNRKKEKGERGSVRGKTTHPLAEVWNQNRGTLPEVLGCEGKRLKSADARLDENPDPAYWADLVRRLSESDFCQGKNDTGWKADFDFLIRPGTVDKILEGKYDNRAGPPGPWVSPETLRLREQAEREERDMLERYGD